MSRQEARGVFERPPGSGIYWARWWDQGRERRKKVGSFAQAREYYLAKKGQARSVSSPQLRTWSVREAIQRLLDIGNFESHAYLSHAKHFRDRFDGLQLDDLTIGELKTWRAERLKVVKPATVAHQLAFLGHVFKQAIEDGWPGKNPARFLRPKFDNRQVNWLTEAQEARLRAELPEPYWSYVEFAMLTGLRKAEQWRLEWSDILGATLWVQKSKTHARRGVPLCQRAMDILAAREHLERPFPGEKNWTFKLFRSACSRAGVHRFTWHALRHTFASRLIQAGVAITTLQKLMGHANIIMTERYAHLAPGALQDAVRIFDQKKEEPTDAN